MMQKSKLRRIVYGVIGCLVLSGLPINPDSIGIAGEVRTQTYTYKRVGDLEIKANVYRADDEKVRPVVVWIHGGALIMGGRNGVSGRVKKMFLDAGYAIVSIDYRLAPETKLPAIIEDVEDAFKWIREKGPELFGIDSSKIAVLGGSAGGYLTLTTGHRVKPRPTALVAFWGYGDLIGDWYSKPSPHPRHQRSKMPEEQVRKQVSGPAIANSKDRNGNGGAFYQFCRQRGIWPKEVSGWDPHKEAKKYYPYMPVKNVTKQYPPTLLIHGTKDTDVPYEQSVMMEDQFKKFRIDHELITIADGEHGLAGGDPRKIDQAYKKAFQFVHQRMAGVPTADSLADEQSKPANGGFCSEPSVAGLDAVREFADNVLKYGRDVYGPKHTPLFVDGLHSKSLEPIRWKCRGQIWVLSNFASQQPLLRILDGLTALTGQKEYRKAAEDATRYALEYLRTPNGMLYWGGHLAWDLEREQPVGQYADVHELKSHQPYYRLMWRVDAPATRQLMEMIWATHILDWSLLDYNRHASVKKRLRPLWDNEFKEDIEVPFPAEGGNLSFVNVTPPLMHSAVCLAVLDKNADVLTWTRRLIYRWQQGRHPHTGLCGGQLSYRKGDRAQDALGHVHHNINEAKIVASYHQVSRYHHLPLAQMQGALTLMAAGGKYAEVGREFVDWASEDLKVYAEHSFDPNTGQFVALMTDGTRIEWRQSRKGYYVPESFAPRPPDSFLLWGYATAYRLTADKVHWRMVRNICRLLDLGDIGQPDGRERALRLATTHKNWRTIYALLELYRATDDRTLLKLACRIADNILTMQTQTGLFPRPERVWARTGDEIPLALLHLAAAINGKSSSLPPAIFDSRFFHCEYHGELEEHQQKRDDKRTYDNYVFYGGS